MTNREKAEQEAKKAYPVENLTLSLMRSGFIQGYLSAKDSSEKEVDELVEALTNLLKATDDEGWCNGDGEDWKEQIIARLILKKHKK